MYKFQVCNVLEDEIQTQCLGLDSSGTFFHGLQMATFSLCALASWTLD